MTQGQMEKKDSISLDSFQVENIQTYFQELYISILNNFMNAKINKIKKIKF